jgi:hypothetical protein
MLIVLSFVLFLQGPANDWAMKIANYYSYPQFKNIEEIAYTFKVNRSGKISQRAWIWDVKKQKVTRILKTDSVTYRTEFNHKEINENSTDSLKKADHQFINDQYWLFFPFHLIWDNGTVLTYHEEVEVPEFNVNLKKLTIQYDNVAGYTPGDAYDLYFNADGKVLFWAYRAKAAKEVTLLMQWKDEKMINGIRFTNLFVNKNQNFTIEFLDIQVK